MRIPVSLIVNLVANGMSFEEMWLVISAALSDPAPGSGIQPLSITLILDSEVVTPEVYIQDLSKGINCGVKRIMDSQLVVFAHAIRLA
jgi:hypothetical protein